MKAIILGCGRTGSYLASILEKEAIDVVVIDKNADSFSQLENFSGKVIVGNGVDIDVLNSAGIKDADLFAAITDRDNTNLTAAQIAKGIFSVKKVACRVYDTGLASIYSELGLDTISITKMGVNAFAAILLETGAVKKYQLGDGSGIALQLRLKDYTHEWTVSKVEKTCECRIGAVIRDLNVIIPHDDFVLKQNDYIFTMVLTDKVKELKQKLGIWKEEAVQESSFKESGN